MTKQANLAIGQAYCQSCGSDSAVIYLDNECSSYSATLLSHAASEELLERRPETYGWTGKYLILQSLDENTLVICHVPGHGSPVTVEEVRYKDKQLLTFVLEHVPLSARRMQTKAALKNIQEEAKHLRSFVYLRILLPSLDLMRYEDRLTEMLYFPLMSPVGENDSRNFLDIVDDQVVKDQHSK